MDIFLFWARKMVSVGRLNIELEVLPTKGCLTQLLAEVYVSNFQNST